MGACSDLLQQILNALTGGIKLKNSSGTNFDPAREDGNLADIKNQITQLDFDGDNRLNVYAKLYQDEVNIGAIHIEDPDDVTAVNVEADDGKNALYVQSQSLLNTLDFTNSMGTAVASPTQYTIHARLEAIRSLAASTDSAIDGLQATLSSIDETLSVTNVVIDHKYLHFDSDEDAGTVLTIDNFTVPETIRDVYLLNIKNASEETDVEIQLYLKETFYGAYAEVDPTWCKLGDTFTVNMGPDNNSPGGIGSASAFAQQIEGAMIAQGLGLSAKLVQGTGSSGAFDLKFILRDK